MLSTFLLITIADKHDKLALKPQPIFQVRKKLTVGGQLARLPWIRIVTSFIFIQ